MGFLEFLIFVGIVVGLAWVAVWLLGYFFEGHHAIFDKLIWFVAIVIVVLKLIAALGLGGYDPQIPHL